MKRRYSLIFALIIMLRVIACSAAKEEQETKVSLSAQPQMDTNTLISTDELVIPFSFSKNDSLTETIVMVCDLSSRRVYLRMWSNSPADDHDINRLKDEIIRLVSSDEVIKLSDEYTFQYMGGYPHWETHYSPGYSLSRANIFFAEKVKIDNGQIRAWGDKQRSLVYYPYPNEAGWPYPSE